MSFFDDLEDMWNDLWNDIFGEESDTIEDDGDEYVLEQIRDERANRSASEAYQDFDEWE